MKNKKLGETSSINSERGVWICCPHKDCEYIWLYTGHFFIYATCPSCRRNIKIHENKMELPPQSVQVRGQRQIAATVGDIPSS
jgi:hypothetical protein